MAAPSTVFPDSYSPSVRLFLPFRIRGFHLRRTLFLSASPKNRSFLSSSAFAPVAMTTETSSKLLDGKLVAKKIRDEIAGEIGSIKESTGIVPGLAVILVGSRKDSQTYVRNKKKACEDVGIASYEANLPEDCSEEEVIKHISKFNSNPSVHGILVQLPLPRIYIYIYIYRYIYIYIYIDIYIYIYIDIYIYIYICFKGKNSGRKLLRCPRNRIGEDCNYFLWLDDAEPITYNLKYRSRALEENTTKKLDAISKQNKVVITLLVINIAMTLLLFKIIMNLIFL